MNLHIDDAIFRLQTNGGISRLWRALLPALEAQGVTIDPRQPADWFLSTYYQPTPDGVRSLALVYDCIAETYPLIGPHHPDAIDKRRAIAAASAVVSISPQTARDVERFFGKRSAVAMPGIEPDYGHVKPSAVEAFQASIGAPYFLVVGRRGLYKNVQALYQAWRIWDGASHFKMLCVGGEEPLPQDRAFAEKHSWERRVLSDDALRAAYAGAVALVYPSLMEGFGLPLLEAMACGCPVVCDRAMDDVTQEVAIYADVTRPLDITRALNEALNLNTRLARITASIERTKTFTWDGMAQTLKGVLEAE